MEKIEKTCSIAELIILLIKYPAEFIVDVIIKPHREKRSIDANNYCWALIGQIAEKTNMRKDDVYLDMLVHYGVSRLWKLDNDVDLTRSGLHYKPFAIGKESSVYIVCVGSSEYDSKEMSVLIDGIKQECLNLGIPVRPQKDIEEMLEQWENRYQKRQDK